MTMPEQKTGTAKTSLPAADHDLNLGLLRQMILIRRFEERVYALFGRGEVYGSTHLCSGQEAVSVGVAAALRDDDRVACTYRGHGHALALGCDPSRFMAEMLGRAAGTCAGRSGSMNVIDHEHKLIGCFGIVGGSIGAATGAALSLRRRGAVAVAFFGDGAVNQAYFAECLNFSKVLGLPVLYVCENNQYSEYTPVEAVTPGGILGRVEALEIPARRVDGQDVWAVREAAGDALAQVRGGGGPAFIEASTYRYGDHGRGDPIKYRSDEEMAAWRERDPIDLWRARLLDEFGASIEQVEAVAESVEVEIAEVEAFALEAPFPDPSELGREFAESGA
jgi:acetoin:2,6-dichlorophenolindophenol oxidoreductase subunit alpha